MYIYNLDTDENLLYNDKYEIIVKFLKIIYKANLISHKIEEGEFSEC